jgi:hypothetical protein
MEGCEIGAPGCVWAVVDGRCRIQLAGLCRGRDLLATAYRFRVLSEQAVREAFLSEFHFHRSFRTTFGETRKSF